MEIACIKTKCLKYIQTLQLWIEIVFIIKKSKIIYIYIYIFWKRQFVYNMAKIKCK